MPLFRDDDEPTLLDQKERTEHRLDGELAAGLGLASLLDGLAVTIPSAVRWDAPAFDLQRVTIFEDAPTVEDRVRVRHAAYRKHVHAHQVWLEEIARTIADGSALWEKRASLFPALVFCDSMRSWIESLDPADTRAVGASLGLLDRHPVNLGFPHSSAIAGSIHALRELRIQAKGRPLRVLYVVDPNRRPTLLIGGDKTGFDRFCEINVPLADRLWNEIRNG